MKFALCDDNPNELRQIRDYLLLYNAQANWKGFASSEELLAAFGGTISISYFWI